MHEFVIMTKEREKIILAADDETHIRFFEEIGYRMTGKGFDEASARDLEKCIQQPVIKREKALEEKFDKVISILMN